MTIEFFHLLLLIIIANGSPIVIRKLLNTHFNAPLDLGYTLADNYRLLGDSKTWRGVVASICLTVISAIVIGYSAQTGLAIAMYAITGDLCSSFIKRRMAMSPSSMAPFLDQLPESVLPAYMLRESFHLDMFSVLLLGLIFIIFELGLSHILYRWGIRKRPY